MTTTKPSSDVITNSLPTLSKLKQTHELELKSQIKITNALKAQLQDLVEQQARTTHRHNSLNDTRRVVVEKSQDLLNQAGRLEADNRDCQDKVESLDKQMLEVREEQRTWEDDYSGRMNEMRERITGSKRNYSPGVVERRGEELRGRKVGLLARCVQLEEEIKREQDEEEMERT